MTNREFFNAIIALDNAPADLVAFAQASVEKLDKSNAAKVAKAAEKRAEKAAAEAPLYNAVKEMLDNSSKDEPVIAAQVASALDISSAKATVILKSFVSDEIVVADAKVKANGKSARVVKAYYKA